MKRRSSEGVGEGCGAGVLAGVGVWADMIEARARMTVRNGTPRQVMRMVKDVNLIFLLLDGCHVNSTCKRNHSLPEAYLIRILKR